MSGQENGFQRTRISETPMPMFLNTYTSMLFWSNFLSLISLQLCFKTNKQTNIISVCYWLEKPVFLFWSPSPSLQGHLFTSHLFTSYLFTSAVLSMQIFLYTMESLIEKSKLNWIISPLWTLAIKFHFENNDNMWIHVVKIMFCLLLAFKHHKTECYST